jgi:hypothetical protein
MATAIEDGVERPCTERAHHRPAAEGEPRIDPGALLHHLRGLWLRREHRIVRGHVDGVRARGRDEDVLVRNDAHLLVLVRLQVADVATARR